MSGVLLTLWIGPLEATFPPFFSSVEFRQANGEKPVSLKPAPEVVRKKKNLKPATKCLTTITFSSS